MSKTKLEQDLDRIERDLRQLKLRYDQFLVGALDREPTELRQKLERLIRYWRNANIQKYADRFRLNTMINRFTAYAELWSRQVRASEEGRAATARAGGGGNGESNQEVLYRTRVADAETHQPLMRELHRAYLEASRKYTDRSVQLDYTDFHRQLSRQIQTIREKNRCPGVEVRLLYDGTRVRLKARPAGPETNADSRENPS